MTQFDEVNGPDSEAVLNFAPTREELIQLVKYWATKAIDEEYLMFLYGRIGGRCDYGLFNVAGCRINRIATVLGMEAVREAIREADEKLSKTTSPQAWSIFKNGTPEEKRAFQEEMLRLMDDSPNWESDKNSEGKKKKGAAGQ